MPHFAELENGKGQEKHRLATYSAFHLSPCLIREAKPTCVGQDSTERMLKHGIKVTPGVAESDVYRGQLDSSRLE